MLDLRAADLLPVSMHSSTARCSLTRLHLCGNRFEDPAGLGPVAHLGALASLSLAGCTSLRRLPQELSRLAHLAELDLRFCRMLRLAAEDLHGVLARLPSLRSLLLTDECTPGVRARDWVLLGQACPELELVHM